jgi:hypothetical protein
MTLRLKLFLLLISLFSASTLKGQNQCFIEKDVKTDKQILVGFCDRSAFNDKNFELWFNLEYGNYNIDTATANLILDYIKSLNITIVLGTWCSDSREQVPRLFKILDYLLCSENQIKMFFVDRNKKAGQFDVSDLNIELVPTIIFYKNEIEVGRIVETPQISLEEDIVDIIFSVK